MVRAVHRHRTGVGSIPAGGPYIVDEFFSTVPGKNFDLCIISTRSKTHIPFRKIIYISTTLINSTRYSIQTDLELGKHCAVNVDHCKQIVAHECLNI